MRNFKSKEFDSPDVKGSGSKMMPHVLNMLDQARSSSGIAYKINSGYRTKAHNESVGGSATSSHLNGSAVDIHCTNSASRERILFGLISSGFQRIGIAKTFLHCDADPMKNPAIWLY